MRPGRHLTAAALRPLLLLTLNATRHAFVGAHAPIYADAKNGAFEFIVELGVIHGRKTLKWSTIYQGKGGKIGANEFPADDAAENFWVCVDGKPIDMNED